MVREQPYVAELLVGESEKGPLREKREWLSGVTWPSAFGQATTSLSVIVQDELRLSMQMLMYMYRPVCR